MREPLLAGVLSLRRRNKCSGADSGNSKEIRGDRTIISIEDREVVGFSHGTSTQLPSGDGRRRGDGSVTRDGD